MVRVQQLRKPPMGISIMRNTGPVAYQSASYLIDIDLTPLKRHIPFKRQRTDREGQSFLPNHVYLRLRLCIPCCEATGGGRQSPGLHLCPRYRVVLCAKKGRRCALSCDRASRGAGSNSRGRIGDNFVETREPPSPARKVAAGFHDANSEAQSDLG